MNEEPTALELCLEYYYYLDYPTRIGEPDPSPEVNDQSDVADDHRREETPERELWSPPAPEAAEDVTVVEDVVPIQSESLKEEPTALLSPLEELPPKKKKKKTKKKAATLTEEPAGDSESLVAIDPAAVDMPEPVSLPEACPAPISEPTAAPMPEAEAEAEPIPVTYTALSLHAAIYNLSKKLDTSGLTALALYNFRQTAREQWDRAEFLQVTQDIYAARSVNSSGAEDRSLKDAIVDTIFDHEMLLDREETKEAFKNLTVGWDLVMKQRDIRNRR